MDIDLPADIIRNARRSAGMSIPSLADRVGVHVVYLESIEKGMAFPSADAVAELARVLKLDRQTLMDSVQHHQSRFWSASRDRSVVSDVQLDARDPRTVSDRTIADYREGWIAGASNRPAESDMPPEWHRGWADGNMAREIAVDAMRRELGV